MISIYLRPLQRLVVRRQKMSRIGEFHSFITRSVLFVKKATYTVLFVELQ